jgi:hypothetical protein
MNPLDLQGRFGFSNNNEFQYQREHDWSNRADPGDYTAEDYNRHEDQGYDLREGVNLDYDYQNGYNTNAANNNRTA